MRKIKIGKKHIGQRVIRLRHGRPLTTEEVRYFRSRYLHPDGKCAEAYLTPRGAAVLDEAVGSYAPAAAAYAAGSKGGNRGG